jgi:hypothetical protein
MAIGPRWVIVSFILLVAAGVVLHLRAGYGLPLGFGDEVVFYYPALALLEQGSLKTAHLNDLRPLHWMPPGFMIVLAGWLKVVGLGLIKARWLAFVLGAVVLAQLITLTKKLGLGWTALALLGCLYLSRHWVVLSNACRMEGLLLVFCLGAVCAIVARRYVLAFSLLLTAGLIHPNTLYFLMALPAMLLIKEGGFSLFNSLNNSENNYVKYILKKIAWWEWLAFLVALVLISAYALFIAPQWAAFVHDWSFQLSGRERGGTLLLLLRPDVGVFLVVWGALYVYAWRMHHRDNMLLLALAITLWVMRTLGQGMAYGIYNVMAVTLTASVLLEEIWCYLRYKNWPQNRIQIAQILGTCCIAGLLVAAKVLSLPGIDSTYTWQQMQLLPKDYLLPTDVARVDSALNTAILADAAVQLRLAGSGPYKVYTIPEGEGIELGGGRGGNGLYMHVLPCFGRALPDYYLTHLSKQVSDTGGFFYATNHELERSLGGGKIDPQSGQLIYRSQAGTWVLWRATGTYPEFIHWGD